jgi:uncharacterized protein (TIGR03084 family)
MEQICDDLDAEYRVLRDLLDPLDDADWDLETPAEGWSIADSVGHLAYFDDKALLSLTDADLFAVELADIAGDMTAFEAGHLATIRSRTGPSILAWWDRSHAAMVRAYRELDPRQRVLWYGPPMAARSKMTARLMETWAHGQDVADALGVERPATRRLRHVCHIGVRARPYAYMVNELPAPQADVYVELSGPDGEQWTWGDPASPDRIAGSGLGFALLATQRRHRDDVDLVATGAGADQWMSIMQAFAGPPGPGRQPLVR